MKRINAHGLSRTRDEKGNITKQVPKDWTMCIHPNAGGGYETMWVLVLEVYEEDNSIR